MKTSRERAAETLLHYFRLAVERGPTKLSDDCAVEIQEIVDDIIAAAVARIEERMTGGRWR